MIIIQAEVNYEVWGKQGLVHRTETTETPEAVTLFYHLVFSTILL